MFAADGTALPGVELVALLPGDSVADALWTVTSTEDGSFFVPSQAYEAEGTSFVLTQVSDVELGQDLTVHDLRESASLLVRLPGAAPSCSLELSVVDPQGVPVLEYCVDVVAETGSANRRHVRADELTVPGTIEGLPPGRYLVRAAPSFTAGPTFYDPARCQPRAIELRPGSPSRVEIRVDLGARIRLGVGYGVTSSGPLVMAVRRSSTGTDAWNVLDHYWEFLPVEGVTDHVDLRASGTYFTEVLPAGRMEFEVRSSSGAVLLSGEVELVPGRVQPLSVP